MNTKQKSNAILLALPGVGKSTIPETIAQKIATAQYPPRSVFFNAKIVRVDFTDLMAGTIYRGSLEQRVHEMVQLAKKDRKIIYFIDEIHTLVGGGHTVESFVDVSRMLLTAMARGDIRILGASTFHDYNHYIKPKLAFARRLPPVIMHEPQPSQCFGMLRHSYAQISQQGRIKISERAIAAAILATKDIPQRYFPDKAIDLIEYAKSEAELTLDDTEDDFILTERHIVEALRSSHQQLDVDLLLQYFAQFIAQQPDYFPGLVDNEYG